MLGGPAGTKRLGCFLLALPPLLGGCGDTLPSTAPGGVSATVSERIGTIVNVAWTTPSPSIGYVSYGTTPELESAAPLEATSATQHRQTLLGLAADTTYYYRVITWDIAHVTAGASEVTTFHTSPLPEDAPELTATSFATGDKRGMQDFVLVPLVGAATTTVGIVNPTGALVWYHSETRDRAVTRARLSSDGKSVLYTASASGENADDSELVRVPLDGSQPSAVAVPGLQQDFATLEDGTLAALVADERDSDGTSFVGDRIVELDGDGAEHAVWSTWDCFDPATSPGDGNGGVWTGASALQVNSSGGAYYVALRNLSSIVKVNRETGECVWILGENESTLEYAEDSVPFVHPGSFYAEDEKLVVLDADGAGDGSRMVDYDLDLDEGTATEVQSYQADPSIQVEALGEATLVIGQDKLVNWANGEKLELVNAAGELKWSLSVDSGESLGYHTAFRDFYAPKREGNQ